MNANVRDISNLNEVERAGMLMLLRRCFDGVTADGFETDLADKTLAVLLRDDDGEIAGFSTMALYSQVGRDGKPATIVCSGDTIVAPEAWGSSTLPRTWINAAMDWHAIHGVGSLHWLLITSGYRTYRFLPVFFETFYPRYDLPTPGAVREWMDRLAGERWGSAYDSTTGVVRFAQPQRLRGELAAVPESRRADPHVRHFLKLNPGHAVGDELVSVCELSVANMTRAGRRMLVAGRAESLPAATTEAIR